VPDDFDLPRDIASAQSGSAECWLFIKGYAATWLTPLQPADGCDEGDLIDAEDRLGFHLPASMREAYRLFARRDDLVRVQDRLLEPLKLHFDEHDEMLIFRTENQWVTSWGIRSSDLSLADPPVMYLRHDLDLPDWQPFLDRFSLACVEMVLSESMLGSAVSDNREMDEDAVNALERHFARLLFPDYPLWANPDGPPTRWFGDAEVVLRDDCRTRLWVNARTVPALDRARADLQGEWLMTDADR
jgi:hypothetical protein